MAHWVGVLNIPTRQIVTGKGKDEVVRLIAIKLTDNPHYQASVIAAQLRAIHETPAIAYGMEPGEEIAKVFSCNCGSVKRHQEN